MVEKTDNVRIDTTSIIHCDGDHFAPVTNFAGTSDQTLMAWTTCSTYEFLDKIREIRLGEVAASSTSLPINPSIVFLTSAPLYQDPHSLNFPFGLEALSAEALKVTRDSHTLLIEQIGFSAVDFIESIVKVAFLETPRDAIMVFIVHSPSFVFGVSVRHFENRLHSFRRSEIVGGKPAESDDVSIVDDDGGRWCLNGSVSQGVGFGLGRKCSSIESGLDETSSRQRIFCDGTSRRANKFVIKVALCVLCGGW